jgi:transketolase
MRLAALMKLHVVYAFSHDSIGVGEDGPTHQPVEHLMSLRAVPDMTVIRPADAEEVVEAWRFVLSHREGPTALILTRQDIPVLDRDRYASARELRRGGYVLWDSQGEHPDIILIGTGSELHIALAAGEELAAEGVGIRVVSLPSWEIFDRQPEEYRESVLPPAIRKRVAVEAGTGRGWEHYVGMDGMIVGLDGFGASAPAAILYEKFGLTVERVVEAARTLMER